MRTRTCLDLTAKGLLHALLFCLGVVALFLVAAHI
jgi:hypothetical protein